jgi:hypothetical protein
MSVSELKLQIISRISSIEDHTILEEILSLVQKEEALQSTLELTEKERLAIEEGLNDVHEGKIHSSIVAENMIKEWLKK